MFFYFIFVAIAYMPFIHTMPAPKLSSFVTLKDNQNNVVVVTDVKTLQHLQSLSTRLASAPVEEITEGDQKKYVVSTGLPKKLIEFLLQLNANIEPEKFFRALNTQAISLDNITRTEIPLLGLAPRLQQVFDDLIIIETTSDNNYAALKKNIAMPFFDTIADFAQDFENQFIISLGQVKKDNLVTLYTLVYPFKHPESFADQIKIINSIKSLLQSKTSAQLLSLLEAANFIGAKPFLLTALYEVYKTHFPKQENWEKELETHSFLQDIAFEVEHDTKKYPSIEQLLKEGKSDFYSIKEAQDPETHQTALIARITGPNVYYLKGLDLIPKIRDCKLIVIENTKIAILKAKDLDNLNNLVSLHFLDNSNLSLLEKNSLRKFNLEFLEINNNKINSLSPDVFILPNLLTLEFRNNQIKTIKSNWAKDLVNLTRLTLVEPELTTLEPDWANGLKKLEFLNINAPINPAMKTRIEEEIDFRKTRVEMPGYKL